MARAKKRKSQKKPSKVKKSRFQYSAESMKHAIKDVTEGKIHIFAAAKLHQVPRTTLSKMVRGLASPEIRRFGPEAVLGNELKDRVVKWISDLARSPIPIIVLLL